MVAVVVVRDNLVRDIFLQETDEAAEQKFLDICSTQISNWDEYTSEDINGVLMNGYEKFGNGSVCLVQSVRTNV